MWCMMSWMSGVSVAPFETRRFRLIELNEVKIDMEQ